MNTKEIEDHLEKIEFDLKKLSRVAQERYFIKKIKYYGTEFTGELSSIGTYSKYPLTMQLIEELAGYAFVSGHYIPLTIHQNFIAKSREVLRTVLEEEDIDKMKILLSDLYGDANGCKLD